MAGALERHWGIAVARLEYAPVGFGSHHWAAVGADGSRWFVSADDLRTGPHAGDDPDAALAARDRAFRTAAALRDAGLEFVLAPIPSAGGPALRWIDGRYAIRVEPFVDGATPGASSPTEPTAPTGVASSPGWLSTDSSADSIGTGSWRTSATRLGTTMPRRCAVQRRPASRTR